MLICFDWLQHTVALATRNSREQSIRRRLDREMHCNKSNSTAARVVAVLATGFLLAVCITDIACTNQQPTSLKLALANLLTTTNPQVDAPKYVGLNALLYKHRGGPQDEAVSADRHPIDGLIEAMKQRPSSKADDKTKSSPNSETDDSGSDREPLAHSDGKTSRRKDAAAGFDESAVQRKSSVADADDDSADAGVQRRRAAARFSSPANGNQWPRQASNNNNNISSK